MHSASGTLRRFGLQQHQLGGRLTGGLRQAHPHRLLEVRVLKEGVLPVDHDSSPFHELDLEELWKGIGRTRVRQHVNPLRREYQTPAGPIDWPSAFQDPKLPLVIDLGCGPGRFLMLLHKRRLDQAAAAVDATAASSTKAALQYQRYNYLGLEIRRALVERANDWTVRLGYQDHVHFVYSNATISLAGMMAGYPGPIDSICIQFPDPHFKRRHRKRRIFQQELVHAVRDLLPPGGRLFLQSDVERVSTAMRNCFELYAGTHFDLAPEHSEPGAVFFSSGDPEQGSTQTSTSAQQATGSEVSMAAQQPTARKTLAAGQHIAENSEVYSSATAVQDRVDVGAGISGSISGGGVEGEAEEGQQRQGRVRSADKARGRVSSGSGLQGGGESSCEEGDEEDSEGDGAEPRSSRSRADDDDDFDGMSSIWAAGGWLCRNPIGVPTEREHYVQQQGLPVYRVLLIRK